MAYPNYWAQEGSRGARDSVDWYGCLTIANVRNGGSDEGSTIFQRRQVQSQCQGKHRSLRTQSRCIQSSPPAARQRFEAGSDDFVAHRQDWEHSSRTGRGTTQWRRPCPPPRWGARPSGAGRAPHGARPRPSARLVQAMFGLCRIWPR